MGTVWHFLCSSSCSGVFMNLWHTSHSNIRVMRCICRWRSNMFFVLQTKLQKTHSNPGRTEAGCTGAWGRGTGRQEQGRDPLSSPLPPSPPVFYTLPDAVPCISVLKEVTALESVSHSPSFHPILGVNQAKRNVLGPNIYFQHHSWQGVRPPSRPRHLLPYLSLAFPH